MFSYNGGENYSQTLLQIQTIGAIGMKSDEFVEECNVARGQREIKHQPTAAADKIRCDSCRVISAVSLYFNFPNPVAQSSFPTAISMLS